MQHIRFDNEKKESQMKNKPSQGEPKARFVRGRHDDGNAFFPDPADGPAFANDELGQELAEDFLASATSADHIAEETRSALVTEELGGPFIESDGAEEFADDIDESNPIDAEPAGRPSPMR